MTWITKSVAAFIVFDKGNGAVLALIVETKGTPDELKLRPAEWGKIQSAVRHFKELGLKYEAKTKAEQLQRTEGA